MHMWWRNIVPVLIGTLLLSLTAVAQNISDTINTGHFDSLLEKGRFPEAIRYANGFLAQSQSIKGDNPHIYLCLAYGYWGAGQEALKHCQIVFNLPKMQFSIDCDLKFHNIVSFTRFHATYPECIEPTSRRFVFEGVTTRTLKLAEAIAYYRLQNYTQALRSINDALQVTRKRNDWRVTLAAFYIDDGAGLGPLDLRYLQEDVPVEDRAAFNTLHHALSHPISDAEARRIIDNMASPEKTRNTWR